MKILSISLDQQIAEFDKKEPSSGVLERQKEYARFLSRHFIIVRTNRKIAPDRKILTNNTFIFPTASLNRVSFIYDAYCIGKKICKEEHINCISTQDTYTSGLVGYLLKRRCKLPLNVNIPGDTIDNNYFIKERFINLFFNKLGKWIIRRADTIRVSTSKEKGKLVKLGIEEEKIWYIPFFINFDTYLMNDGTKIRQSYLDNTFDKLILSVGRISKQKDLSVLISAIPTVIKKYPRCLFLIVGGGPQENFVKRLVSDLRVSENIRFAGDISYPDIPDYFAACDIFVITSLYEGTCMVLLEAAISKKPIISTKTAGAYDVILDGQTGYLVDFRDSTKVAEKILYLMANPGVAEDMGKKGRELILPRFNKEKILQDYAQMCEATAQKNGQ